MRVCLSKGAKCVYSVGGLGDESLKHRYSNTVGTRIAVVKVLNTKQLSLSA